MMKKWEYEKTKYSKRNIQHKFTEFTFQGNTDSLEPRNIIASLKNQGCFKLCSYYVF